MSVIARRDVFQVIADATHRKIISMIIKEPLNLNAIAAKFDISRPAVSPHIKILEECGMASIQQNGGERYVEARLQQLNEVVSWVEKYRKILGKNIR